MLGPTAATFAVSPQAVVRWDALLALVDLLESYGEDPQVASVLRFATVPPQSDESEREVCGGTASAARTRSREFVYGSPDPGTPRSSGPADGRSDLDRVQSEKGGER